jgi:hypothetical protein
LAEIAPVLIQNSRKSAFYAQFMDEFSGYSDLVETLQDFFSSLLSGQTALRPTSPPIFSIFVDGPPCDTF